MLGRCGKPHITHLQLHFYFLLTDTYTFYYSLLLLIFHSFFSCFILFFFFLLHLSFPFIHPQIAYFFPFHVPSSASSIHPILLISSSFLLPYTIFPFITSVLLASSFRPYFPNTLPSFIHFLLHSSILYSLSFHPSFRSSFSLPSFHPTAHHLSPQALKWREYRRKNPLGVEKRDACSSSPSSSSSLSASAALTVRRRTVRRNVFDFPPSNHALNFSRLHGAKTNLISIRGHLRTFYLTDAFLTVHFT